MFTTEISTHPAGGTTVRSSLRHHHWPVSVGGSLGRLQAVFQHPGKPGLLGDPSAKNQLGCLAGYTLLAGKSDLQSTWLRSVTSLPVPKEIIVDRPLSLRTTD